jgi:protein CpxP
MDIARRHLPGRPLHRSLLCGQAMFTATEQHLGRAISPSMERKMIERSLTGLRSRWVLQAAAAVTLAAAAAVPALAQGHPPMGMAGGPGGEMMLFGGPPEHVARMLDGMLDGLGASDSQRRQIRQIAMAASADVKAQRDTTRGLHEKGMQIFTAPTVDAAAAESLRQQMLAQHDQASRRELQAMLDVAKVLTPEQRARIGARLQERQAVMRDRMQRLQAERGGDRRDRGEQGGPRPAP